MAYVIAHNVTVVRAMVAYRKVGGLHFIRVGRFGCSFYVSSRNRKVVR